MLLVETISLQQAICGFGMLSPSKESCVKGLEEVFADKGSFWPGQKM